MRRIFSPMEHAKGIGLYLDKGVSIHEVGCYVTFRGKRSNGFIDFCRSPHHRLTSAVPSHAPLGRCLPYPLLSPVVLNLELIVCQRLGHLVVPLIQALPNSL